MAQIDIKYKVTNAANGAVAARIATLAGPGPLLASPEFFLSQILPEIFFANGVCTVTQHNLEQWYLQARRAKSDVKRRSHRSWWLRPNPCQVLPSYLHRWVVAPLRIARAPLLRSPLTGIMVSPSLSGGSGGTRCPPLADVETSAGTRAGTWWPPHQGD